MDRWFVKGWTGLIIFVFALAFCINVSAQEVPHVIKYRSSLPQGGLFPLMREHDLTFRIYDQETNGNLLWQETHPQITIFLGVYEVALGSIDPVNNPLELSFDQDYWYTIELDTEGESDPREKIWSAGYSYMAEDSWRLGGRLSDEYALVDHNHLGTDIITPVPQAINADTLDGLHASELGGGVTNHGNLTGLENDDHLQYLTSMRGDTRYAGINWDGTTQLADTQNHIADLTNPHQVTLDQLEHVDNNTEEEAPSVAERGEPTGTEIQEWAANISAWGHNNLVTGLNADLLDGLHVSELGSAIDLSLEDLSDISADEAAALNAAGNAGANATNRLALLTDIASAPVQFKAYDSGWFAVDHNKDYSRSHNLGTTKAITQIYVAQNSDGSGWVLNMGTAGNQYNGAACHGIAMTSFTPTTISIHTQDSLFQGKTTGDSQVEYFNGYARIIMLALE